MRVTWLLVVLALLAAEAPAADALFIPEVAHTRDGGGRTTKTDLTIRNDRAVPQDVEINFAEENYGLGEVNIGGGVYVQLQPFETRTYEDVIDQLVRDEVMRSRIPAEGIRGRVIIAGIKSIPSGYLEDAEPDPEAALSGSYRTYMDAAEGGTMSESFDSIPRIAAQPVVFEKGTIGGLHQDIHFKTDLVIWNHGETRTFRITMRGYSGTTPRTMVVEVESGRTRHVELTWNHGALSVVVELLSPRRDGPWGAYGTTTDRRTGDGWTQALAPLSTEPALASAAADRLIIPVAANVRGAFGTHFKTDVALTNHLEVDQVARVEFFAFGRFDYGDPTAEATVLLPPGGTLPIEDVLSSFLWAGPNVYGTLIISGIERRARRDTNARLSATYRIWTPSPQGAGTMSQSSAALDLDALPAGDESRVAIGVRHDENFRCNVGIYNGNYPTRRFRVTASSPRGSVSTVVTARGFAPTQVPLPPADLGYVTITFEPLDAEMKETDVWTAYATSVDNRSGDSWLQNAYAP